MKSGGWNTRSPLVKPYPVKKCVACYSVREPFAPQDRSDYVEGVHA